MTPPTHNVKVAGWCRICVFLSQVGKPLELRLTIALKDKILVCPNLTLLKGKITDPKAA